MNSILIIATALFISCPSFAVKTKISETLLNTLKSGPARSLSLLNNFLDTQIEALDNSKVESAKDNLDPEVKAKALLEHEVKDKCEAQIKILNFLITNKDVISVDTREKLEQMADELHVAIKKELSDLLGN